MEIVLEGRRLILAIQTATKLYFNHGSRSSKKVDYFHNFIKNEIEHFIKKPNNEQQYSVDIEKYITCMNSTGKKKCDIVVYKNKKPIIVFPVKIIMTNYKQNKNNYFEQQVGEFSLLKWANPQLNIIPINIILSNVPYLKKTQEIIKFESINYTDDLKHYELLQTKGITYANMTYIIDVEHVNVVGEKYNTLPHFFGFNVKTKYTSIERILFELIK